MKDRTPAHPGRVRLVPVDGQNNIYDITMADDPTEVGTPLNKDSLLKDSTAIAFGLDNSAVPDDALAKAAIMLGQRPRMSFGSYVGNGSGIKTFIFDFDVDVLVIAKASDPATGAYGSTSVGTIVAMRGETGPHLTYININDTGGFTASFNGRTVKLSPYNGKSGSRGDVMNTSGETYIYCALGITNSQTETS